MCAAEDCEIISRPSIIGRLPGGKVRFGPPELETVCFVKKPASNSLNAKDRLLKKAPSDAVKPNFKDLKRKGIKKDGRNIPLVKANTKLNKDRVLPVTTGKIENTTNGKIGLKAKI